MTSNKQLVAVDLSARLYYGIICQVDDGAAGLNDGKLVKIDISRELVRFDADYYWEAYIDEVKPYLRSMSSMTEEEREEYYETMDKYTHRIYPDSCDFSEHTEYSWTAETFDWLNKKMFDYRGLIPKGLAIEAPEGMYS